MNISLTPELEQLVKDKVNTGRYHSVSEVMGEALEIARSTRCLRRATPTRSRAASSRIES